MNKNLILFFLLLAKISFSQFAPPAGHTGTTAVHKDSIAVVNWAGVVYDFKRGASDIANGWTVLASFGDSTEALGYAQGNSTNVVSLGDSGYITLQFTYPIMNGAGNDFAVFENSFSDDYLEFAFVEVSTDGINFVRFPSVSLTDATVQTDTYQNSNTELVHNLAGKFKQGYGTPFDLEDLVDSSGIDLDSIWYVRIVDVVGTIDPLYASFDSEGNIINDPYPTDFAAGGFDLDGVGVINENNIYATQESIEQNLFNIYPNPSDGNFFITTSNENFTIEIFDASGKSIYFEEKVLMGSLELSEFQSGIYFVRITFENSAHTKKLLVK